MTLEGDEILGKQLAELTAWRGGELRLWRRALHAAGDRPVRSSAWERILLRPTANKCVLAVAAVVVIGFVASLAVPLFSRAREGRSSVSVAANVPASLADRAERTRMTSLEGSDETRRALRAQYGLQAGAELALARGTTPGGARREGEAPAEPAGGSNYSFEEAVKEAGTVADRHIVHKATIELAVKDVRAAFLKAGMLVSEATGEYVQDSSLSGSEKWMQANLTLRVDAGRLSALLNELRQLGEVRSERIEGEDVTLQVVDLEARLRNERRVEEELLQLLDKRQDAPLDEVLKVRGSLSDVREEIERLTAQREKLAHLVSLATVLVIIRTQDAQPDAAPGLGSYFTKACRNAWRDGVSFLVDTVAVLLAVLVGGVIWWVLLVVVGVLFVRWRRRRTFPARG